MFTIIGGDGKEYGPATVEQIRGWIAAGRANLETKAKALGSDEWRRLGDYAEFTTETTETNEPPPIPAARDPELADRLYRLGAWFIDNVFAFVCCLPGWLVIGVSVMSSLLTGNRDFSQIPAARLALGIGLLAIGGLAVLITQVWMLVVRGQTVGKRMVGIRIVRVDDGRIPGFVSVILLRWFVPGVITTLLNFVFALGYVFWLVDVGFIFREDRRCIHDLIAGTKVVKAE